MGRPSPSPSPERAVYGFVWFVTCVFCALAYLIFAIVPHSWLADLGIDFLPNRYWAVTVPLAVVLLIVCIIPFNLFWSWSSLSSVPVDFDTFRLDEHSRAPLTDAEIIPVDRQHKCHTSNRQGSFILCGQCRAVQSGLHDAIPLLYDIPLHVAQQYSDSSNQ